MCCKLCKPNTTEREHGLDNCRMPLCSCHTTPPTYDKYKDDCPKCGATAFRGCLHKGYLTPEVSTPPTPSGEKSWDLETEYTERFAILYANYSGREDESRATFRIDARILLRNYLSSRLTEIEGKILKNKQGSNFVRGTYGQQRMKRIAQLKGLNQGLDTALQIIKKAREK